MVRLVLLAVLLLAPAAIAQRAVSWDTLAQVKLVRADERFVPEFQPTVLSLRGQRVRVQGFMMPLDQSPTQQHFVLSANPVANCFYCMPGGPESMIEVRTNAAVEFSYEPITLTGELELLENDPMGMYYRLKNATVGR